MADPVGLRFNKQDGAVPSGEKLRKLVDNELLDADTLAVVVLKDMYAEFRGVTAETAKASIWKDAGSSPKVHAHVARHDFEAWLLPYWNVILGRISNVQKPWGDHPEDVNDDDPPAHRLQGLYHLAKPKSRRYKKPSEAAAILRGQDLAVAAGRCPELKAFLNTLLRLSKLPEIP